MSRHRQVGRDGAAPSRSRQGRRAGRFRLADRCPPPDIDFARAPPNPDLLQPRDRRFYLRFDCIPWRRAGGRIVFAASDPPQAGAALAARFGGAPGDYPVAHAPRAYIRAAVLGRFQRALVTDATEALARYAPLRSAKRRLSRTQSAGVFCAFALIGAALAAAPFGPLFLLNILLLAIFVPVLAFRITALLLALAGPLRPRRARRRLTDAELPVYTVLAPLYREANIAGDLVAALTRLDYPAAKLDIKLIVEADDLDTRAALARLDLPDAFDVIVTPPCRPRTKPKACNYGLAFAKGDYVTIFDADDRPDPGQLRAAASVFAESPPDLACLQASLTFYNRRTSWLTRHFAVEYATHFGMLLPTLERADWPIPLGGTSNHFRADVLRRVGAWDAYNVTEDADLGLRLASAGYRCRMLASHTAEEATARLKPWILQRSRWMKGYSQTLLVNNRRPGARMRRMGFVRFLGLEIFLGGAIATGFAYPVFPVLLAGELLSLWQSPFSLTQGALAPANLAVAAVGAAVAAGSTAWGAMRAGFGAGAQCLALVATAPIYRFWVGVAGGLALWDLVRRPNHWRKTPHGVGRRVDPEAIRITRD